MNFASSLDMRHLFTQPSLISTPTLSREVMVQWKRLLHKNLLIIFTFSCVPISLHPLSKQAVSPPLVTSFYLNLNSKHMRGREVWYLCTKSVLFHLTHQSLVPDPLSQPEKTPRPMSLWMHWYCYPNISYCSTKC